jgi:hypothetical protein
VDGTCDRWPDSEYKTVHTRAEAPQTTVTEKRPIVVGVKLEYKTAGQLTALRFYKTANEVAPLHRGAIYTWPQCELVCETPCFSSCAGPAWASVQLASPVYVEAGQQYILAVDGVTNFGKIEHAFPAQKGDGLISVIGSLSGYELGAVPMFEGDASSAYLIDGE